ncbi:hypothetical protein [Amycolatopsis sp. cg9]|uniref:hypothetical protein n=1 Tax=Amycolatopsis sp. cg9 TaxID=3238801 RepID=UPI003525E8E1
MKDSDLEPAQRAVAALVGKHGTAIEALVWARGLDDWCGSRSAGYGAARDAVAGTLAGARYVVNRSVHQLAQITPAFGVMRFPLDFRSGVGIFNTFGGTRWAAEGYLPARDEERDEAQRRLRDHYLEYLAGRDVGSTLTLVRDWFERQLAEPTPSG